MASQNMVWLSRRRILVWLMVVRGLSWAAAEQYFSVHSVQWVSVYDGDVMTILYRFPVDEHRLGR